MPDTAWWEIEQNTRPEFPDLLRQTAIEIIKKRTSIVAEICTKYFGDGGKWETAWRVGVYVTQGMTLELGLEKWVGVQQVQKEPEGISSRGNNKVDSMQCFATLEKHWILLDWMSCLLTIEMIFSLIFLQFATSVLIYTLVF